MKNIQTNQNLFSDNDQQANSFEALIIEKNDSPRTLNFLNRDIKILDNHHMLYIYEELNCSVVIENNSANIYCFTNFADIEINGNRANLYLYGDHNKITVNNNLAQINIYGFYSRVEVENNDGELHIYGNAARSVIKHGKAYCYGYYQKTVVHKEALVETQGKYQDLIDLSKIKTETV